MLWKTEASDPEWGVYDPRQMRLEAAREFERRTGIDPLIVSWREDFSRSFPMERCTRIWNAGRVPLIRWDAEKGAKVTLNGIIQGDFDEYLKEWADGAKLYDRPVLVHFLRQFNLGARPWSLEANGGDGRKVAAAFRHVVKLFRARDAEKVRWVWGANVFPSPAAEWNRWESAWPGDDVVDYVALDGLDFGESGKVSMPLTFDELFASPMRRMRGLAPRKPILITEVGTARTGSDRAKWIRNMLLNLRGGLLNLRGIVWFHHADLVDWRVWPGDAMIFGSVVQEGEDEERREKFLSRNSWFSWLFPPKKDPPLQLPVWKAPYVEGLTLSRLPSNLKEVPLLHLDGVSAELVGRDLELGRDFSAKMRIAWNQNALLVWCEVKDHTLGEGRKEREDIWDGDGWEIDIGESVPTGMKNRAWIGLGNHYRIQVSPGGASQIEPSVALVRGADGGLVEWSDGLQFRSQFGVDNATYRLFGVIPWRVLGLMPIPEMRLPFNVAFTDGEKGHRVRQLIWSGGVHAYHTPEDWGILELSPP